MNKKTQANLQEMVDKYNTLNQLVIALAGKGGVWNTDKALYEFWEEYVRIEEKEDGTLIAVSEAPEGEDDFSCTITDPELIELINEMRPKPKKSAKKKAEKKVEKKNYKNATWMDAFRRVANYMGATRYALNVGDLDGSDECAKPIEEAYKNCTEDDEVSVQICDEEEDREGEQWLRWDSVKDFLTNPLEGRNTNSKGCPNIFESVALWQSHNRYKLEMGSPYIVWLIDTIGELGKVNIKKCDTPAKLMKELDKAGIE